MTRKEKAAFVIQQLEALHPEVPIPLQHKDSYTLFNRRIALRTMYGRPCESDHTHPFRQGRHAIGHDSHEPGGNSGDYQALWSFGLQIQSDLQFITYPFRQTSGQGTGYF